MYSVYAYLRSLNITLLQNLLHNVVLVLSAELVLELRVACAVEDALLAVPAATPLANVHTVW